MAYFKQRGFGVNAVLAVLAVALLLLLPAGRAAAGTAEEVPLLPTLDALNRAENPLSNAGKWSPLNWTTGAGTDTTGGWKPASAFPAVSGAYWNQATLSDAVGDAAMVTMPSSPAAAQHYGALWLNMPAPGVAKSGYQLRWKLNADTITYTVTLSKWLAGAETLLTSNGAVSIPAGSTVAISDTGATVAAWKGTPNAVSNIASFGDSTYSSGYAGLEGAANGLLLTSFKAGTLVGGALSATPVLDDFARHEAPIENGKWSKTAWAAAIGSSYTNYLGAPWHGYGVSSGVSGAYWNQATYANGIHGQAVAASVGTGSTPVGQHVSIWLTMPSPASERSGYELRFTGTGSASAYKAELARWAAGTRTVLATKENVPLPVDSTFVLSKSSDSLVAWTGGPTFTPLLFARDATYASGYAGIEVNGSAGTYYNFRAGKIALDTQAPETTITSGPSGAVPPSEVFFSFSSSELGSLLECSMDSAAYTACTSPKSFLDIPLGAHTFRVRATDPAGNQDPSPAERSFSAVAAPSATTLPASGVKPTSANLNASVNPNGLATTYFFEYGTSQAYGSKVPATAKSAGSGHGTVEISEPLTGLTPGTKYHRRVVATNAQGTTYGGDRTFITTAPPTAVTGAASEVTASQAKLSATVNPRGVYTTYYFEYGTTTAYGAKVPATPKALGSGYVDLSVSDVLSGLTEGTKYHYRVVAVSELGTAHGADVGFDTPLLPDIELDPALAVDATDAVLAGMVDPNGEDTEVKFEYGTTPLYATSIAGEEEASGSAPQIAEEGIVDLQPNTTYHYRLAASSAAGTVTTPERTFTTAAAAASPPAVVPANFYGLQWGIPGTMNEERGAAMAKCSGAKWLRIDILNVNVTQQFVDEVFLMAAQRGIRILPHLGGSEPLPGDRAAWVAKVKAAVARYGRNGTFWSAPAHSGYAHLAPVWWEVWNEPNYKAPDDVRPKITPAAYGVFLKETAEAVKFVDSQAKILGGSLLSVGVVPADQTGHKTSVRQFVLNMGNSAHYDALAVHPYAFKSNGGLAPAGEDAPKEVQEVAGKVLGNVVEARAALDKRAELDKIPSKPIWITEIGWPVIGTLYGQGKDENNDADGDGLHVPVSPEIQRDLINAAFNRIEIQSAAERLDIHRVIYYNLQDSPDSTAWYHHTGLRAAYNAEGQAKVRPAWHAFKNWAGFHGKCLGPPDVSRKTQLIRPRAATSTLTLNPNGLPTKYWIKWDSGPSSNTYNKFTTAQNVGTLEEANVDRQAEIPNLQPNTTYHYRVVAENDAEDKVFLPPEGQPDFQFTTPPPTSASVHVDRVLHGQPGWAWASGWVKEGAIDGPLPGLDGVYVNVNFVRNGQTIKTVHPVVHDGKYETGWVGDLGRGPWEVRTVMPPQAGYDEAKSPYDPFTVRDGVQLTAKHSGKCLDVHGASIANWAPIMHGQCLNPVTSQNQVFSMAPHGDGYLLIARHSGRCVSVADASLADGAKLVQWDCDFANHFRFGEEWWGPSQYARYFARHSGKCIDVTGASTGWVQLQQWTCNGADHQLLHPEPVDSAPIPTQTSITVDQELHGSPGLVSFRGHLQAAAYPMVNRKVYVEFDNADTPAWDHSGGLVEVTVNASNAYEVRDHPVDPGRWNVRARYAGTPEFAASTSASQGFTLKRGYIFENRFSNQCLQLSGNSNQNGAAIIQWPCSAINGNGQVLSFWPRGDGWYDIRVNGTNRCVDVAGVNPNDNAVLQLWDCGGGTYHNQHWKREPIEGQNGWFGLRAKHSGRCASNYHWSTAQGSRIIQWGCVWAGNQQWDLQGVIDP